LAIFNRLPKAAQIAAVYSVIVFVVYSWTLLWFFWKYPSWLYFLNIGEIATVLAYSLATNFFESLLVLVAPLILAVILPKKWFYDAFVAQGIALVLPILGYMMYIAYQFESKLDYPTQELNWAPVILLATLLLVFVVGKVVFLRKALEFFADHSTIFIYISVPISLISVLVVVIRILT
jgi:hypothetical protein